MLSYPAVRCCICADVSNLQGEIGDTGIIGDTGAVGVTGAPGIVTAQSTVGLYVTCKYLMCTEKRTFRLFFFFSVVLCLRQLS